ncbi:MAG: SpaA isopeptide-forming pilin-related protein [Faecalibacterium prausnitzii]
MTKANSNLHRAAALLAALCLLASMALPVYAAETETEFSVSNSETIPDDDNTGNGADGTGSDISVSNLETIQKDADTTNEGSKTEPEISVPNSETITSSADTTDKAAGAPLTEGVTGSENTAPADSAAADKTAPDEEKTNLTEENTSDDEEGTADNGEDPAGEAGAKETFFAADTYSEDETESDDRSAPMTASNEGETASFIPNTVTIYFAVDSNYQDGNYVHLYADRGNGNALNKDMVDTGKVTTNDGRKIFSVSLNKADYPEGGFYRLIFQYHKNGNTENGNTWRGQFFAFGGKNDGNKNWTTIDKIAGKMFDATTSTFDDGSLGVADNPYNETQWTRVEYYYAGMPLYFKNASDTTLNGVTATFYKKGENNTFEETGSQTIGTVAANTVAAQKITIPNNQSQFVKFSWAGYESEKYYNFSKDSYGATEYFDLTANNCFVYSGNGSTGSPWQNAGGDLLTKDKTIYFDATLSSYAYAKDYDIHQNPMPGSDNKMYCFFVAEGGSSTKVEMVKDSTQENSNRQLWSCTVPAGGPFTAVQFSAREDADGNSAVDDLTKKYSTAEIPPNLKDPCFFADDGDPSAYTSGSGVYRDGYWGEKGAIRDAESGKGTTVVDVASDKFTQEAGTKYITSTLYDYYTDYELNGFNRDSYPNNNTISQRGYVTFEQFNRALSSAYEKNGNVQYPIYTGHFQPSYKDWSCPFADVATGMGLYGWGDPIREKEKYNTFMAVNNSVLDTKGEVANDEAGYARTFQGLVEDKTLTGDANGLPVLKGKAGTGSLVDPHFNKEFLEGKNTFNTVLGKVYENVSFPFTKDAVFKNTDDATDDKEAKAEYWYYDSSKSSLYLTQDKDNGKFYLESTKDDSGKLTTDIKSENRKFDNNTNGTCGFFPFNESVGTGGASQYNYGFGAKLQFDFTLTNDGMVQVGNDANDKVPIKFFFSGDDDVWVYIDGQLVLDVGGAHGKASGLLEFGQTTDGKANTVTPYVSSNKTGGNVYKDDAGGQSVYFNGRKVTFDKKGKIHKGDDEFTLAKGTTHTLTMFYMERGMWESNMAVAFNFPDNNELQVEKKVDVTGVNDLFKDSFQNQKIFTFNIKNLATHYVPKDTSYKEGETEKLPENAYKSAHGSSDASASLEYVQNLPSDIGTGSAVLWSATMDDPTSAHREKRRGTLPLSTPINIGQYSYLTFDVYVEGKTTDTCALGNLYVELLDTAGKQKGCINGKGLQSSDVYGAATGLHPGQWYTIRLLLNSLETTSKDFNNTLQSITVGDNFARKIYLRNFTFRSAPKEQTKPGFTTEQYDIPDYNSATTGKLENAKYAVFSSDRGNGDVVDVVDENGQFLLQDGETVTFKDQFRRGSYIALQEQVDPNLYDTFWTVYENDAPVTNVNGASEYVTTDPDIKSLENVKDTAPDDGRTELVIDRNDKNGKPIKNEYSNISMKPKDNTLVFRSYSGTADKDELTKLKVVFTNKVKTGKLIIRKYAAGKESLLNETFTFTVKFSDVGGQGLGVDIPEQEYKCTVTEQANGQEYGEVVIDRIPVGTRFVVSEVAQEGTNLQLVTISGGKDCAITEDGKRVRGSVVEGDANVATAKFVNTKRQLTDLVVTKQWVKQDGKTNIPNNELPAAIYLKLQRTKTPNDKNSWRDVTSDSVELKRGYDGWVTTFTGLDKFDAEVDPYAYYTYRVLESVTADGTFYGGSKGNVIEIGGKKYTILNNTVSCADDSKTSLALTLINQLQDAKYNLNITKQDAEDKTKMLGGVEFKLEKLLDKGNLDTQFGENGVRVGLTAESTGLLTFDNLSPGSYRLTETKTAEGYTLLADAIEFTLTTDGECKRDATDFGNVKYDSTTGVYNIALTINNRKSFELPHTGADAPSLWLLIGLPALVAVLLVLVFRYNKKGGRRQ